MKETCAPLQPSCTLAPRQSLGRWGMLSPHLLQGPCLLSLKTSPAVCSWSLPSLYSLLISTSLSHRGRLIIALGTCDTGRGGGRIPVGLDVLLKTSRMLRDNSLVPTERGQFLQLGSYLGMIWGLAFMLEAGKWTEDTPKPSTTSTCELRKGLYQVSWLLSSPICKMRF